MSEPAPSDPLQKLRTDGPRHLRYKILDEVGRGGMGVVHKVWDQDLSRNLAMKLLLSGAAGQSGAPTAVSPRNLNRFLEEAQITGQLDHPGIVPVHEVGLAPDGRVYFTMRYVQGRNLEAIFQLVHQGKEGWNQTRALGVLLKVCDAMAYAHDKGVVHRDLKPSNIMVGRYGEAYVMDWGLARAFEREDHHDIRLQIEPARGPGDVVGGGEELLRTVEGDVVGTPAYMPPEQALGQTAKLGPTSDVYSVGAMLYELLTEQIPYADLDAVPTPRTMLNHLFQGPPTPIEKLRADVPPELVAICEKAMAREPSRRYADMTALDEDLRAYLECRVVSAHATGAVAEFTKWVKRNKGMAAAIVAAIVVAIAGLSSTAYVQARAKSALARARDEALGHAQREREQAEEAKRQRDAADRVVDMLIGLFESPDPSKARGREITAREILDRGARSVMTGLEKDPIVQAKLMAVMGKAYFELGRYAEAEPLWTRALEERRRLLGDDHPDTIKSQFDFAGLLIKLARYVEGETLFQRVLEARQRSLGPDHPDTLAAINAIAISEQSQGHYTEAETLMTGALDRFVKILGEDHEEVAVLLNNLAAVYRTLGRHAEALPLLERALQRSRRLFGDDHPDTFICMNNLAAVYRGLARYDQAEQLGLEVLEGRRRVLGEDHEDTLDTLNNLALVYSLQGHQAKAEDFMQRALNGYRRLLGDEHPTTLAAFHNLGLLYQAQSRYRDAEPLMEHALEGARTELGDDHPHTLEFASNLGLLYEAEQRFAEAETLYEEAVDGGRRALGSEHPQTLNAIHNLAHLLHLQHRDEEAEPLARELVAKTPSRMPAHAVRRELLAAILSARQK